MRTASLEAPFSEWGADAALSSSPRWPESPLVAQGGNWTTCLWDRLQEQLATGPPGPSNAATVPTSALLEEMMWRAEAGVRRWLQDGDEASSDRYLRDDAEPAAERGPVRRSPASISASMAVLPTRTHLVQGGGGRCGARSSGRWSFDDPLNARPRGERRRR